MCFIAHQAFIPPMERTIGILRRTLKKAASSTGPLSMPMVMATTGNCLQLAAWDLAADMLRIEAMRQKASGQK